MSIPRALTIGATIALAIFATAAAGIWAYTAGAWAQCNGALALTGSCQTGAAVHNITAGLALVCALACAGLAAGLAATRPGKNGIRR